MSTTYDPKATFLGVPLTRYRDTVRRFGRYRDVDDVCDDSSLKLAPQTVAVLVNEADMSGFFAKNRQYVHESAFSDLGRGFAAASPMKALPRKKADAVLSDLLANCAAINARDDLCFVVRQVWVFGSYAKGADQVNDIDIAIDYDWIPGRKFTEKPWHDRTIRLACEMGGAHVVYGTVGYAANAVDYLQKKLTFGARKNPKLSNHHLEDLKSLAVECRLLFDKARGGPVQDPLLPKHPDAGERGAHMFATRSVMPELRPFPLAAPVHAGFAPGSYARYRYFVEPDLHRVETEPKWVTDVRLRAWAEERSPDGRARSLIAFERGPQGHEAAPPGCGVMLGRSIEEADGEVRIRLSIEDCQTGGRRALPADAVMALGAKIVLLAGCDIEAAIMKSDMPARISVELDDGHPASALLRDYVEAELRDSCSDVAPDERSWLSPRARALLADGSLALRVARTPVAEIPPPVMSPAF